MKKGSKTLLSMLIILLFVISFLPSMSNAEWKDNLNIRDVLMAQYGSGQYEVVQLFIENYPGSPLCLDPIKFYFPVDDPKAKYMYTHLLTALLTRRPVNLFVDDNNPECFNEGARVHGVWIGTSVSILKIEISGEPLIDENTSTKYECRVYYSDGTDEIITPSWSEDSINHQTSTAAVF